MERSPTMNFAVRFVARSSVNLGFWKATCGNTRTPSNIAARSVDGRFKEPWFLKNHMKVHINKLAIKSKPPVGGGAGEDRPSVNSMSSLAQEAHANLYSRYISCLQSGFLTPDKQGLAEQQHQMLAKAGIAMKEKEMLGKLLSPMVSMAMAWEKMKSAHFWVAWTWCPLWSQAVWSACKPQLRWQRWTPPEQLSSLAIMARGMAMERSFMPKEQHHEVHGQEDELASAAGIVHFGKDKLDHATLCSSDGSKQKQHPDVLHGVKTSGGMMPLKDEECKLWQPPWVLPSPWGLSLGQGLEYSLAGLKEKTTECSDCGRVFRTYHQMVVHSRVHNKDRRILEDSSQHGLDERRGSASDPESQSISRSTTPGSSNVTEESGAGGGHSQTGSVQDDSPHPSSPSSGKKSISQLEWLKSKSRNI